MGVAAVNIPLTELSQLAHATNVRLLPSPSRRDISDRRKELLLHDGPERLHHVPPSTQTHCKQSPSIVIR